MFCAVQKTGTSQLFSQREQRALLTLLCLWVKASSSYSFVKHIEKSSADCLHNPEQSGVLAVSSEYSLWVSKYQGVSPILIRPAQMPNFLLHLMTGSWITDLQLGAFWIQDIPQTSSPGRLPLHTLLQEANGSRIVHDVA